jgi:sigma-E factor negative regulatory protein RseA
MSEQIRESVSALMDGEANELELERLLNQSQHSDVRTSWIRYQLASQAMQGDHGVYNLDVSASVMAAIEAEDAASDIAEVARSHRFSIREVLKPVASFAVAASVFAAVLVGSQLYGLVGTERGADPAQQIANRTSPVGMVNTVGGAAVNANYGAPAMKSGRRSQHAEYNRLARKQLQRYLLPHTDEAALNTPQGMMPYARLAALRVED